MKRLFVGLFLAVAVPACLLAETPAAMLYTNGNVEISGTPVKEPTAVFSGAMIETGKGTATLRADHTTVEIPAASKVIFNGSTLVLLAGSVQVSTTNAQKVQVAHYVVSPTKGKAVYRAAFKGACEAAIASKEDALSISSGSGAETSIAGGAADTLSLCASGGEGQAGNGTAAPSGSGNDRDRSGAFALLGMAAGGGALAGVAVEVNGSATTKPALSPSAP